MLDDESPEQGRSLTAGQYIGSLRRDKGLTMRDAARLLGLRSAGHWSDLEHDKKSPENLVHRIAKKLGGDSDLLQSLVDDDQEKAVKFTRGDLRLNHWRLVCEMHRRIDELEDWKVTEILKRLSNK